MLFHWLMSYGTENHKDMLYTLLAPTYNTAQPLLIRIPLTNQQNLELRLWL